MLKKEFIPFLERNIYFQFIIFMTQLTVYAELLIDDIWKYLVPLGFNPAMWIISRVGPAANPRAHTLAWIAILLSAIYLRLKTPWKASPIRNMMYSFLAFLLIAMLTEGIWHVFYFTLYVEPFVQHLLKRNTLTYWKVNQSTILTILEIITGMTAAMIAGTYRLFDRKLFLIGLAIFLSYMIWWRLTGMPITLTVLVQSANQTTAYYNDLYVNLLEILH